MLDDSIVNLSTMSFIWAKRIQVHPIVAGGLLYSRLKIITLTLKFNNDLPDTCNIWAFHGDDDSSHGLLGRGTPDGVYGRAELVPHHPNSEVSACNQK
jgi:hypothetical protein